MKKRYTLDYIIIFLISLYLIVPLALTFMYSSFHEWSGVLPHGFTLEYYVAIFTDPLFLTSLLRSLFISIFPVIVCNILMILVLYVTTLYCPKLEKYIEILCNIPYAISGVILAVGILSLYSGLPGILSNRLVLLVGSYCIIILPYVYRGLKNGLNTINVKYLVEAALMLGCSKFKAFIKVILPNMLSGIVVSMMLSISMIFADFVIVNIIGGSYYQTSSIYLYDAMNKSGQTASAVIVVLFLTTLILSTAVVIMQNKSNSKKERV